MLSGMTSSKYKSHLTKEYFQDTLLPQNLQPATFLPSDKTGRHCFYTSVNMCKCNDLYCNGLWLCKTIFLGGAEFSQEEK
jgi:hypothetical protein